MSTTVVPLVAIALAAAATPTHATLVRRVDAICVRVASQAAGAPPPSRYFSEASGRYHARLASDLADALRQLRSLKASPSDAPHLRALVASFGALQDRAYTLYVAHRDPSPQVFAPDNRSPGKVIARVDRAAKALPAPACVQGKAMRRALTLPALPTDLFH